MSSEGEVSHHCNTHLDDDSEDREGQTDAQPEERQEWQCKQHAVTTRNGCGCPEGGVRDQPKANCCNTDAFLTKAI